MSPPLVLTGTPEARSLDQTTQEMVGSFVSEITRLQQERSMLIAKVRDAGGARSHAHNVGTSPPLVAYRRVSGTHLRLLVPALLRTRAFGVIAIRTAQFADDTQNHDAGGAPRAVATPGAPSRSGSLDRRAQVNASSA